MSYIGRFAPSPTGPLHFGSLLAALASFLDARANQGTWILRIEDLDPPREQAGVKDQFPKTLEAFGLYWDGELSFQSQRLHFYQEALTQLLKQQQAYLCNCSRKQIRERSGQGIYDKHCLIHPPARKDNCAVRIKTQDNLIHFADRIQGPLSYNLRQSGDFVVYRRDGLFAYLLAVVVDDYLQGVTHVVRGSDLLDETPKQIYLQQLLGYTTPNYAHIPVATNANGQKLSKQTFAKALDATRPEKTLFSALQFLNLEPQPELKSASKTEMLEWAIKHWDTHKLPKAMGLISEEA
ncbi:MAG: tRNA glutamyl-Q(34) synthetase GluQRS [Neptuniibacter caesariensis]|uniref:Glutamyl-Q tRNA(Asp) synthetase n=1 Tax=Neptuniibacter caesariensis TaxID=207954 RepID=A0A2G6JBJ7_NEPCE|nr:MAG: tRNA glutamyl-Q(34) synthetase GluQRS [Neptuniibacter caesariensis]